MKKILTLLLFAAVALCACDPGFNDEYYLKNTLSYNIKYAEMNPHTGTIREVITVRPGASERVWTFSGIDMSCFESESNPYTAFCQRDVVPVIIFPGEVQDLSLAWAIDDFFNFEKHPKYKHCWSILQSEANRHRSSHRVEYRVDETDYENAYIQHYANGR